jgi:hypothetical protein
MIGKIINPVFQDAELLEIYNIARDSLIKYETDNPVNLSKVISALEILKFEYLMELRDLNNT